MSQGWCDGRRCGLSFARGMVLAAAVLLLGVIAAPLRAAANAGDKPNVLFILVDDLGWADVSPDNPKTFYDTGNIAKFATTAERFTNAYAACPVCSPTRSSILTGQYPVHTGVTDYISASGFNEPDRWTRPTKMLPAPYADRMSLNEVTLAEAFKAAGYATFFAGKWHLGPEGYWPQNQGFDINIGGWTAGGPYTGHKYFSPYNNPEMTNGPAGEHLPHRLAEETVKFIKQHKDGPFLAYLAFYSVHIPLMGRKDLIEKYKKKAASLHSTGPEFIPEHKFLARAVQSHVVYGAMVDAMDQAVGTVLKALDDLHLSDNTIVVFFSDNGGLSTSEGHPTSNLPLRGGKGWLYEGGIREPCMIRVPGMTKAGSVCDSYFTSTDFYPTLLALAGLPARPKQTEDGVNIEPILKNAAAHFDRGPIFWHYPHYGNQGGFPGSAIRDGDYKLIENYDDGHVELYNLADDIGEHHDLAAEQPTIAARLKTQLDAWLKQTHAKMPMPNPKYDEAGLDKWIAHVNRAK